MYILVYWKASWLTRRWSVHLCLHKSKLLYCGWVLCISSVRKVQDAGPIWYNDSKRMLVTLQVYTYIGQNRQADSSVLDCDNSIDTKNIRHALLKDIFTVVVYAIMAIT